jgi:hypothetical protein
MKLEYYKQYLHLKTVGLRAEARQNLLQFINSFASFAEKEQWTRQFLETEEHEYGYKIRHELYEGVVFPALLKGYQNQDPWSILWLARTARNFEQARHLHEQIDLKTGHELLKECYSIDPSNAEVQTDLLRMQVRGFEYCIHEDPAGILSGQDGATIDECQEILAEIEFVRKLDPEKIQERFLNEVQSKVLEYLGRLQKYQLSTESYKHF